MLMPSFDTSSRSPSRSGSESRTDAFMWAATRAWNLEGRGAQRCVSSGPVGEERTEVDRLLRMCQLQGRQQGLQGRREGDELGVLLHLVTTTESARAVSGGPYDSSAGGADPHLGESRAQVRPDEILCALHLGLDEHQLEVLLLARRSLGQQQ